MLEHHRPGPHISQGGAYLRACVGSTPAMFVVEFCGMDHPVDPETPFTIGRDADLVVDEENQFLHRRVVQVANANGFWWITNVGSRLPVTVSGEQGSLVSHLGPGASMPIVLDHMTIMFSAGSTSYELSLRNEESPFVRIDELAPSVDTGPIGEMTIGAVELTPTQFECVLVLSEPMLRRQRGGITAIPSNADAAKRLNWPVTTFNRKLDSVCEKFARAGVQGLRGEGGKLATSRRARLVEYVVTSCIVRPEHLELLDDRAAPS